MLVVEPSRNPRHGGAAELVFSFRRPWIVHHPLGVGEHGADECDPAPVGRPQRVRGAFKGGAHLPGLTPARDVENEELIGRADFADEREAAPVRRPFRGMIPPRRACGLDRLRLQKPADHDPAPALSRLRVGPSELVGHAFAIATQPDVVDPAKSINVFGADRGGHRRPPMLSAGNMLSVSGCLTPAPYRLRVTHL